MDQQIEKVSPVVVEVEVEVVATPSLALANFDCCIGPSSVVVSGWRFERFHATSEIASVSACHGRMIRTGGK